MKPAARVAIYTLVGLTGGGLALTAAVCGYLRSSAGSAFILSKAKENLARKGIRLEYKDARIDPFSTIRFQNLKLTQATEADQMEVDIKSVDVRFELSLLKRFVLIEKLEIDQPHIRVKMRHSARTAPVPSAVASSGDGLDWLRKPPVSVSVRQVKLTGLHLDLDYQDGISDVKAKLDDLRFQSALELVTENLSSSGEFQLGDQSRISVARTDGAKQVQFQLELSGLGKWAGTVRSQNGKWTYELQPTNLMVRLRNILVAQEAKDTSLHLRLGELGWEAKGRLVAHDHHIESLELHNQLSSGKIKAEQSLGQVKTLHSYESMHMSLDANQSSDLMLRMSVVAQNLASGNTFLKPGNLECKADAHLSTDLSDLKLQGSGALNGIELFTLKLAAQAASGVNIQGAFEAIADPRLAGILKPAASLKQLGAIRAKLGWNASLSEKTMSSPAEGDVTAELIQASGADPVRSQTHFSRARDGEKTAFNSRVEGKSMQVGQSWLRNFKLLVEGESNPGSVQAKVKGELGQLMTVSLKAPVTASLDGSLDWDKSRNEMSLNDLIKVQNGEFGNWEASTRIKLAVGLPEKNGGTFLHEGTLKGGGITTFTQLKPGSRVTGVLSVEAPVVLTHQMDLHQGQAKVELGADAPTLDIPRVGKAIDSHILITLRSPDISSARDIDLGVELKQGHLTLAKELSSRSPTLTGLNLELAATLRNEDQFTLTNFKAEFNHSMVKMTAEATGKVKQKDFQTRGMIVAQVPSDFPAVADQDIQGHIEFPWTLSILRGREINFEGNLKLIELAWSKGMQRIEGVSGNVPVSEKLLWDGQHLKFASLITQNPFERVDYERLRPLIDGANQVRIEKIGFEEKTYGPFVGYFSMSQNMIFAHQFDFGLGTTGRAYGEIYFDVLPANLQMGFLTRFTALNLSEILPQRYLIKAPQGDKKLSARTGLVVNLNKGSVDGRVDITEIGGSQLITLINVLDPRYEDDKMNMARTALGVGYPTFVEMAFQNGFMDLGMDLSVLGVGTRFDVRGIPIYTKLSSATADIVKKTQEGPLK